MRSYLRKIAGKTAALFSLSLQAGAQEAKAPRLVAQRLRRSGYDMGMAFQVIDDILDFESTEGVMRKPVGRDLAEGLCTLPLIHALRRDEAGIRARLATLRDPDGKVDEAAVQALIARCTELGGVDEARKEATLFTERAKAELALLPACAARDELEDLADRLLVRDY